MSQPVRVLFVNTRSSIGADVAVHISLIQSLPKQGVEVHVATNSQAIDHKRMVELCEPIVGGRIVSLKLGAEIAGRSKAQKLIGTAKNLWWMVLALLRLRRYVRNNQIDVIHVTDRPRDCLVGTLLASLTNRKSLIHVHIKWYSEIGRITTWASRRCSGFLAISKFVRKSMVECGIPADKIYLAYNATDSDVFDPSKVCRGVVRNRCGSEDSDLLVGVVARIMKWKGQLDLVETLPAIQKQFPNAKVVLVGKVDHLADGEGYSYADEIRRRVADLGLEASVVWAGWIDDMPGVMADLDVVVVPSWEEPFGLVVTEALSMERPLVGYATGAIPEIVRDQVDGLLVPAKDPDRLAGAVCRSLEHAEASEQRGRSGRRRVIEQFQPHHQASQVKVIYEQLRDGQPPNDV